MNVIKKRKEEKEGEGDVYFGKEAKNDKKVI